MQATKTTSSQENLNDTVRKFELWRTDRARGARIPAALWRSAASLAATHGVSKTATALRLDYYALKKRLVERPVDASATVRGSNRAPRFVEVSLTSVAATVTCSIEIEKLRADAGHTKLRLELGGVALTDLGPLLRSVWSSCA